MAHKTLSTKNDEVLMFIKLFYDYNDDYFIITIKLKIIDTQQHLFKYLCLQRVGHVLLIPGVYFHINGYSSHNNNGG